MWWSCSIVSAGYVVSGETIGIIDSFTRVRQSSGFAVRKVLTIGVPKVDFVGVVCTMILEQVVGLSPITPHGHVVDAPHRLSSEDLLSLIGRYSVCLCSVSLLPCLSISS